MVCPRVEFVSDIVADSCISDAFEKVDVYIYRGSGHGYYI